MDSDAKRDIAKQSMAKQDMAMQNIAKRSEAKHSKANRIQASQSTAKHSKAVQIIAKQSIAQQSECRVFLIGLFTIVGYLVRLQGGLFEVFINFSDSFRSRERTIFPSQIADKSEKIRKFPFQIFGNDLRNRKHFSLDFVRFFVFPKFLQVFRFS